MLGSHTGSRMRRSDLATCALFLDIDGTLLNIGATPDDVVIPDGLVDWLDAVSVQADGALAVLSGRALADIDRFLAPLTLPAAGTHGAEIRAASGGVTERKVRPVDDAVVEAVREVARSEPGTVLEVKPASVALHYRLVPGAEAKIEAALRRILEVGAEHLTLCRGRKVLEVMPRHVSKGAALEAFMQHPPFYGRRPVMVGDDVSDMSAFDAATRLGGVAFKVAGEVFSEAEAEFSSPAAVRFWLATLAGGAS